MKHFVISAVCALALAAGAPAQVKIGDPAPNFEGEFTHADAKTLSDFKGRVVLLDFWRTW